MQRTFNAPVLITQLGKRQACFYLGIHFHIFSVSGIKQKYIAWMILFCRWAGFQQHIPSRSLTLVRFTLKASSNSPIVRHSLLLFMSNSWNDFCLRSWYVSIYLILALNWIAIVHLEGVNTHYLFINNTPSRDRNNRFYSFYLLI